MAEKRKVKASEKEPLIDKEDEIDDQPRAVRQPTKLSIKWSILVLVFFFATFAWFAQIIYSSVNTPTTGHRPSRVERINQRKLLKKANKILEENPLIDGHVDLAWKLRRVYKNRIYDSPFKKLWQEGGLPGQLDIPRLKKGKYSGAFWSTYIPCPMNVTDFSDEAYGPGKSATSYTNDGTC